MSSATSYPSRSLSRRSAVLGLLALPLLPTLPLAARAAEDTLRLEGQNLPRRITLGGQDLLLNGAGLRGWYKAYIAVLYLARPARSGPEATALAGPKRLQIRLLFDLPASAFADAFRSGVMRNTANAQETAALESRVAAFQETVKALGKLHKGDVFDIDLDPAQGTLFSVNGTLRGGLIPGPDFFAALLRAFIGEQPYDDKLKAGLLGATA